MNTEIHKSIHPGGIIKWLATIDFRDEAQAFDLKINSKAFNVTLSFFDPRSAMK